MSDTKTYTEEETNQAVSIVSVAFIEAIDDLVTDESLANKIKKTAAANMLSSVLELLLEDNDGDEIV